MIQAFRNGRLPSNQQIDETLKYVLDHSPVDQTKLSPEGRKLVQDTRDIIDTARLIVVEKNKDELFQNFFWHTKESAHKEGLSVPGRDEEGAESAAVQRDKTEDEKGDWFLRHIY